MHNVKHNENAKRKISQKLLHNKNAEKLSEADVEKMFTEMLEYTKKNPNVRHISTLCAAWSTYEEKLWELKEIHKRNKFVSNTYKSIKNITKNRLINGSLDDKHNTTMSIFLLKTAHEMNEKQNSIILNYNVNDEKIQNKTAAEITRDYAEILRGVQKGK